MNPVTLLYITFPSKEEAVKMAKHLVEAKLIACANIFPISSIYRWEGKISEESEFAMLAKTTEDKFEQAKSEIEKTHPYDIPCILKLPAEANDKFFGWMKEEVGK